MQNLFFELIRVALGQQSNLTQTPSNEEWYALFDMADSHSLLGICFAGIEELSKQGLRPLQDLLYEWIGTAQQIEERNKIVNRLCLKLQDSLNKDGFRSCILKGQGNTLLYKKVHPQLALLRQSGDIDVWIEGGFDKVFRYVQNTCPTDEVNEQHIQLHVFDDTEVELHYTPSKLANRWKDKKLQKWFLSESDRQMSHSVSFGDGVIVMPTDDFNLVYQMLHIYRHFFSEGIGLRQLTDYYVLLRTCQLAHEERVCVKQCVSRFGMERFAAGLMWLLGYVFYLPETKMLWEPDECRGRFLLSEVMQMGNFGHSDNRFRLNESDSHIKRYFQTVKSKWRFIRYFPSETLWQPLDYIVQFIEIRRLRRKAVGLRNELKC